MKALAGVILVIVLGILAMHEVPDQGLIDVTPYEAGPGERVFIPAGEQNLAGVIALCARLRIPLTRWQIDVLRKMKPRKGAVRS